jgi:cysteinyl-tRNA synthetase
MEKRQEARAQKNWELADKIREEIDQIGYVVEDTPEGPIAKRK